MPNTNINDLPESNFYVPVFVPNVGFSKKELSSFVNNGNLGELIVPLYNEQSTAQTKYNKGDYCIHDRKLYKCVNDDGTYGPWVEANNWDQITVTTLIQDYINKNLKDYVNNIDLGNLVIDLYDESKEDYAVGDCVIYNKELYKCRVENTRELPTVETDWEQTTLIKLINNKFNELGVVLSYEGNKTVAQLNALTTRSKKPGRVYSVTDTGTLTEGTFDNNGFDGNLRPGDEVALNSSKLWTYLGNVTNTDQFITVDELSGVTAPKWNENHTYTLGASVLHERKVYVCKVDSATVGTWVSSEWRQIKVGESFGQNTDGNYTYPGLVPMVSGTDKVLTEEGWMDANIASKEDVEDLFPDPLNPLNLPRNTIRCKFKSGYTPDMGDTQTLVDEDENVWDIYKQSNDWSTLFNESDEQHNLLEVLGANTKNVTSMFSLFHYCTALTSVALFDTSNVTDMQQMFYECESLTTVPLFNTSNVTNMFNMFSWDSNLISVPLFDTSNVTRFDYVFAYCTSLTSIPLFNTSKMTTVEACFNKCVSVETGILDLYNQMNNQSNPPTNYENCFTDCGKNTTQGAAELAQIPDDWKGVTPQ